MGNIQTYSHDDGSLMAHCKTNYRCQVQNISDVDMTFCQYAHYIHDIYMP